MKKRILLLIEDPLMADFFTDKLEAAGFELMSARASCDGVNRFRNEGADLILVDPIFSTGDGLDAIRAIREHSATVPILILGNLPRNLIREAQSIGMTQLVFTTLNPFDTVLTAIDPFLPIPIRAYTSGLKFSESHWMDSCIASAPTTIKAMRLDAYSFAKTRTNAPLLFALFSEAHLLAERLAAVGLVPLWKMARSIEMLVYDLYEMPEEISDSTVRTAVQAVDFLGTLFDPAVIPLLSDPVGSAILAVDDEPMVLQTISQAMEKVGLVPTCALHASDALGFLQKTEFKLVLLDIGLPSVNGFDICKQAREIPLCKKTPMVFLTGMTTFQNRALSTLSGGNDFIGKPFNLFELGTKALSWVLKGQLSQSIQS